MKAWLVFLAVVVIFGSGMITGAVVVQRAKPLAAAIPVVSKPAPAPPQTNLVSGAVPWPMRAEFLRRMEKQLNLTDAQKKGIEKSLRASQERMRPLWEQVGPQMKEELTRVRAEVRDQLTPEQQQKFDEVLKPRGRRPEPK